VTESRSIFQILMGARGIQNPIWWMFVCTLLGSAIVAVMSRYLVEFWTSRRVDLILAGLCLISPVVFRIITGFSATHGFIGFSSPSTKCGANASLLEPVPSRPATHGEPGTDSLLFW